MFFNRRVKLRELAEAEALGQSFWTAKFDPPVRVKLGYAITDASQSDPNTAKAVESRAAYLLARDEGWTSLPVGPIKSDRFRDLLAAGDDDYIPSAIEAVCLAGSQINGSNDLSIMLYARFDVGSFIKGVNDILSQHRISFELIDGEMVPFESRELHVEIVEPTLRLLAGSRKWHGSEAAYQDALRELSSGHADDAITDAGRALQETLSALGCEGNALGPLLASARKKGLLGSHDQVLTQALANVVDWASADRSAMGDAHVASEAKQPDAWFAVHVIGALILRLTHGPRKL